MIFPSLNCSFGGISAVTVGWNALEVDFIFGESCFDGGGTLVVYDVELWSVAIGVKEFVGIEPCVSDGGSEAVG